MTARRSPLTGGGGPLAPGPGHLSPVVGPGHVPACLPAFLVGVLAAAVALLCAPAPAAAGAPPRSPSGGEDPDAAAIALLDRAAAAARSTAYEGVQFVSTWSDSGTTSFLVDVGHVPGEGTAVRVRGTATAAEGEAFVTDSADAGVLGLAGAGSSAPRLLSRNYDVAVSGTGTVVGRSATLVEVRRHDGGGGADAGPAARFWVDDTTGLVLRREVYASGGRTVRASAFLDISFGSFAEGVERGRHLPSLLPGAWPLRVRDVTALRRDGWTCPDTLAPSLTLYDARRGSSGAAPVLHLSYSDGLSSVSVFEQRGQLDEADLARDGSYEEMTVGPGTVHVRAGFPRRVVWSAGGTVYTVVSDAPADMVDGVVAALPHDPPPPEDDAMARIRRGLDRVMSWFNPFG